MGVVFVPFDGWSPSGSYFGEGWSTVRNLYPAFNDWRPWRRFVELDDVADGPMIGGYVHTWASGIGATNYRPDDQTIFAGSEANLYTINPTTGAFTDISRAAAYTANPGAWRFASVGNDIWAANWVDVLQRRTNNAGNFADGVTSTFVPEPRFIATIREHLVGANLSNGGRFQDEFVWSDADNALNFDPPTGTSTSIAGAKRLISVPGQITGLVGGQYGLAFKRTGIFYLEYSGPPAIFRPDVLSSNIGTAYPSSIINSRYGVFFLGPDGFYQISGLSAPQKISTPGIDQFLLDGSFTSLNLGTFKAWQEDQQMRGFQAAHWPLIGWGYSSTIGDYGNRFAILYNPVTSAWAHVELSDSGEFADRPTVFIERPYAANIYESLAALTWPITAKYAPMASTGVEANIFGAIIELRYRPAGIEELGKHHQAQMLWVLPVFSKTTVSGTALNESVTVSTLLDPHNDVWKTETCPAANRDTISGAYPFENGNIAGRLFKIAISGAAEDFANFEGAWVATRPLTQ